MFICLIDTPKKGIPRNEVWAKYWFDGVIKSKHATVQEKKVEILTTVAPGHNRTIPRCNKKVSESVVTYAQQLPHIDRTSHLLVPVHSNASNEDT